MIGTILRIEFRFILLYSAVLATKSTKNCRDVVHTTACIRSWWVLRWIPERLRYKYFVSTANRLNEDQICSVLMSWTRNESGVVTLITQWIISKWGDCLLTEPIHCLLPRRCLVEGTFKGLTNVVGLLPAPVPVCLLRLRQVLIGLCSHRWLPKLIVTSPDPNDTQ